MRYAGIVENDIADGINGICVSFWTQGCPHRCKGCQNPETWEFDGGEELPENYLQLLRNTLIKNNISRDLSILGGEPLCDENKELVANIVKEFKDSTDINIWTGYYLEDLIARKDPTIDFILKNIFALIDGPFILEQRNLNLPLRGSDNQRILYNNDIIEAYEKQRT